MFRETQLQQVLLYAHVIRVYDLAAAAAAAGFAGALAVVPFHDGGYYVLGLESAVGYDVASSGGAVVVRMIVLAGLGAEALGFVSATVV